MSGLFSTFNIAKKGMMAHQTALNVVSHNIANSDTDGYSVQRANFKTTTPFGMPSLDSTVGPGQLGTGVDISDITRSRDSFLDVQIRKETATSNQYEARQEFLTDIETIFNEPSDTGMSKTIGQFWDAWQQLATNPESSTARTLVVQNGESLTTAINHTYSQLEDLQTNAAGVIKKEVFDVSTILTQIQDLNVQIKSVVISGQQPNDLLDRRDKLLDDLSKNFSFDVKATDFDGIEIDAKVDNNGTTSTVNVLKDSTINSGVAYVNNVTFKVNVGGTDHSYSINDLPKTIPTGSTFNGGTLDLYINGDMNKQADSDVTINSISDLKKYFDVEDVKGSDGVTTTGYKIVSVKPHTAFYDPSTYNQSTNKVATAESVNFQSGSFKGYESISQEIDTYKNQLNNLARSFAIAVNTIHSGKVTTNGTDVNALNFFVSKNENSNSTTGYDNISSVESDDEPAKTIAVNKELKADSSKVNAGKVINRSDTDPTTGYKSGNGDRALLMGQLRNTRLDVLQITNRDTFKTDSSFDATNLTVKSSATGATIDSYYQNTISFLGVSGKEADTMVTNQKALLDQLDLRKEGTSGVSLDEEITNMVQFQRAYEANSKMISVLDELLDTVVNGLVK